MSITFGQAKKRLSQFAGQGGKCPDNDEVDSFVREVLDYMLTTGPYGSIRKFNFNAIKGVITAPYELETILKAKINGEITSTWDRWFEWYGYGDMSDCLPANAILEEPNYSPIVYDLPMGGAHVGTLAICDEDDDAFLIVKGFDTTGRQVITQHKGEQVVGEYLRIKKGHILYTTVRFGRITEIYKTKTNGYVQLLWINLETNERGFLADYTPLEETPKYRRFRLNTRCGDCVSVSVLGRIRLKEVYTDNDLIPFDNMYALTVAAQAINSNYNNDPQTAQAKDIMLQDLLNRENNVKKTQSGQPVEVFIPLSGGSIKNIIF